MVERVVSEVAALGQVVLAHPRDAFDGPARIDAEWRALNFTSPPDLARAIDEYDAFAAHLTAAGADVLWLPPAPDLTIDSLYPRDATVITPRGVVLARMGKPARVHEPLAQARALRVWGIPVVGAIEAPGQLEGGDVAWLGDHIVAVGCGYRTNAEGIRQFRALLGDAVECIEVPLPHWRGPSDVFHLMSMLSPVDRDLAVVYAPLLPVPFRQRLIALGYELVEVPDEEFESMGANVLALAPRRCLALTGNPVTRRRLEQARADVTVYEGREISLKGGGGPTCLTRPLWRRA